MSVPQTTSSTCSSATCTLHHSENPHCLLLPLLRPVVIRENPLWRCVALPALEQRDAVVLGSLTARER